MNYESHFHCFIFIDVTSIVTAFQLHTVIFVSGKSTLMMYPPSRADDSPAVPIAHSLVRENNVFENEMRVHLRISQYLTESEDESDQDFDDHNDGIPESDENYPNFLTHYNSEVLFSKDRILLDDSVCDYERLGTEGFFNDNSNKHHGDLTESNLMKLQLELAEKLRKDIESYRKWCPSSGKPCEYVLANYTDSIDLSNDQEFFLGPGHKNHVNHEYIYQQFTHIQPNKLFENKGFHQGENIGEHSFRKAAGTETFFLKKGSEEGEKKSLEINNSLNQYVSSDDEIIIRVISKNSQASSDNVNSSKSSSPNSSLQITNDSINKLSLVDSDFYSADEGDDQTANKSGVLNDNEVISFEKKNCQFFRNKVLCKNGRVFIHVAEIKLPEGTNLEALPDHDLSDLSKQYGLTKQGFVTDRMVYGCPEVVDFDCKEDTCHQEFGINGKILEHIANRVLDEQRNSNFHYFSREPIDFFTRRDFEDLEDDEGDYREKYLRYIELNRYIVSLSRTFGVFPKMCSSQDEISKHKQITSAQNNELGSNEQTKGLGFLKSLRDQAETEQKWSLYNDKCALESASNII